MTYSRLFAPPDIHRIESGPDVSPLPAADKWGDIYFFTDKLILAVNVAMVTGRPLLLAGPPGSGKSTLARHIAHQLNWRYYAETVTTQTRAQDLLYHLDLLKRLYDANAARGDDQDRPVDNWSRYVSPGVLWWAFNPDRASSFVNLKVAGEKRDTRPVVRRTEAHIGREVEQLSIEPNAGHHQDGRPLSCPGRNVMAQHIAWRCLQVPRHVKGSRRCGGIAKISGISNRRIGVRGRRNVRRHEGEGAGAKGRQPHHKYQPIEGQEGSGHRSPHENCGRRGSGTCGVADRLLEVTGGQGSTLERRALEFLAIMRHQHASPIDDGLEVAGPSPDGDHVAKSVDGIIDLQVHAFMLVREIQLTPVVIVAVGNHNARVSEIGQHEQDALLDVFELAAGDHILASTLIIVINKQLGAPAEVFRQKCIQERHIVIDAANLKDLLSSEPKLLIPVLSLLEIGALLPFFTELTLVPTLFDFPEQLDAELVGIEAAWLHGDRAGVVICEVDDLGVPHGSLRHDGGVPERGPSLVHDLGLCLRCEVIGFVADDRECVVFPGLEGGMLEQKQENIALWVFRKSMQLLRFLTHPFSLELDELGRIDVRVHVGAIRAQLIYPVESLSLLKVIVRPDLGWLPTLDERGVIIDQILERETGIDERFHPFGAESLDVPPYAGRMVGHLIEHLSIGMAEPEVILEEVTMRIDVSNDHLLISHRLSLIHI